MISALSDATREEQDSMGVVHVPADAYWGAQTERSRQNFSFAATEKMPLPIIYGLAHIKAAAAQIHRDHGLDPAIAEAIITAADAIIAGEYDDQFPLTIFQTGSGTQSNMNVNEVIAGIANEAATDQRGGKSPVHPNDHVNKGQSSNDSFPTAIHIAVMQETSERLIPALQRMEQDLAEKTARWEGLVKVGRTHLQDAAPLTLGQEFSGYGAQVGEGRARIEQALHHDVAPLAQGGTAVGTGLNAPPGFGEVMTRLLSQRTGFSFTSAPNKFAALAAHDGLVHFSGTLNALATALMKIANDIRLLGSGPRAGLNELIIYPNEPGSSIMPGKTNPTQCEMLTMVAAQVIGNHQAITIGGMQGHLELNVFKPLIGANLLRSIAILADGIDNFTEHCLKLLTVNERQMQLNVEASIMMVTALAPHIGYDRASAVAHHAHHHNMTPKEAAIEMGVIDGPTYDRLVVPAEMVGKGIGKEPF